MQSKRDQVQAHSFIMSRLTAGMLLAEPDAPESPLGRTTRGTLVGVLVAVLICAGAVVWGLISPGGSTSWQAGDSLIVNKETGARYLYAGGRLLPVRNYASARLLGGAGLKTTSVGSRSLQGTAIGTAVGIPGAPDNVPPAGDLDGGPWLVCSSAAPARNGAAARTTLTTLLVGATAEGKGLTSTQGLVVRGPDSTTYLVWQGSRLRLDKASGAAVSLGYGSVTPRPVSAAFLDALVTGPALTTTAVPGLGEKGPELDGRDSKVGQAFTVRVPGSTPQYYLLGRDGLVPLTDTGAALLLGDPKIREKAYEGSSPAAAALGADVLKQHQAPGTEGWSPVSAGLPASPPRATGVPEDQSACAAVASGQGGAKVTTVLLPTGSLGPAAQVSSEDVAAACLRVDAVVVRPGHAALVRALGAAGTDVGNTTYLVGDTGAKYRVPNAKALGALGYSQDHVAALPSPLLAMLPSGPDLDPEVASGAARPTTTSSGCAEDAKGGSVAEALEAIGTEDGDPNGDSVGEASPGLSATGAEAH